MQKRHVLALLLWIGTTSAGVICHAQKPISLKALSHSQSRTSLQKILGGFAPIDSTYEREGKDVDHKVLIFAPVQLAGFHAIARARVLGDSVSRLEFLLSYTEHPRVRPYEPYAEHGFVQATVDDLTRLRDNIGKEFGEPSVMAETFFEYLASPGVPAIRAQLVDRYIIVSILANGTL